MSARSFRSCGPPAEVRAAHAWPRPRVIGWANGNRRGLDPFRGSRCFQTSLSQREGSPRSGVSFRFKVRGGFRPASCGKRGHRPERVSIRFEVRGGFRHHHLPRSVAGPVRFQSALRFAVVSDPTPWHAVLTSPVAAVLHTTPSHPLQQADRTCPKWGKTPSQVAYTPEAVFGRSPALLPEGCLQDAQSRGAGRLRRIPPRVVSGSGVVVLGSGLLVGCRSGFDTAVR